MRRFKQQSTKQQINTTSTPSINHNSLPHLTGKSHFVSAPSSTILSFIFLFPSRLPLIFKDCYRHTGHLQGEGRCSSNHLTLSPGNLIQGSSKNKNKKPKRKTEKKKS